MKILEYYKRSSDVVSKEDGSPLTKADLASHEVLMEALTKSGLPVVSEEGDSLLLDTSNYWLIDPLDLSLIHISEPTRPY